MLSENVLADLTRSSPTQYMVVAAAWPSLSTESRLQVIAALQGDGIGRSTPDWLLDLAMTDAAEIVRYWAARSAYFREEGSVDFSEPTERGFRRLPAPPEDLARVQAARHDSSALVRLSVYQSDLLGATDDLTSMEQPQRLIAVRNQTHPSFSRFIDWLGKAIEAQVADAELAQCAAEFFAHPQVIEQLKEDDFDDGMTAHFEGKAMVEGWALLKGKAGPALTNQLVYRLPVKRGLGTMKVQDLAEMPERVLEAILYRKADDETFAEVANLVRSHPDRFPPGAVKWLERDDEDYAGTPSLEEKHEYALRYAIDRQAAALEALLEIRRDMRRLHERLNQVEEVASRKRGIFG